MFRHGKFAILTSIITITAIFCALPTFAADAPAKQDTPKKLEKIESSTPKLDVTPKIDPKNIKLEPVNLPEKKENKNILQKAGDLGKKGLDGVKNAGSKVGDLGKKGIDGIKSGASAVAGVFKNSTPCSETADSALKAKDSNIEKTKLDTKQNGSDGENGDDGKPKSGTCVVAKCKKGYAPNDSKTGCEKSEGECTPTDENATAGELKKGKCIITECGNGWHPSDDGTSCEEAELSEAGSKQKVDDLKANAQKMKEKEQSLENRMLGAAAIGATGIGGMNLMSGMAEQKSDQAAEEDMKAYLATFVCDYGAGRNIKGGEMNIDLPGGNDLMASVTEYRALAADLKVRKEALGKQPGIEAEVIYDIAETGLYDNVGMGRQSGAYTSLSRALTDENSKDAEEWAKQKADTASKIKTGAITAGAGAIGGLVGNLAINSGEKNKNQLSKLQMKNYEKKQKVVEELQKEIDKVTVTKKCVAGASGTYPDCTCTGNSYFHADANECTPCGTNEVVNNAKNGCDCKSGMERAADGTCGTPDPKCKLTGNFTDMVNCKCTGKAIQNDNTNTCECTAPNYKDGDGNCVECPTATHTLSGNTCTEKIAVEKLPITIPGDSFFDSGRDTLTQNGETYFQNLDDHIKSAHKKTYNTDATSDDLAEYKNFYACVVGHTDKSKYTGESDKYEKNMSLSLRRAKTIAGKLKDKSFTQIYVKGAGPFECENNSRNNKACRKVVISLQTTECGSEFTAHATGGGTN